MRKKIALHGSYYGDNFGDSLFVKMFVEWITEMEGFSPIDIVLPFASERVRKEVGVSGIKGFRALELSKCIVFIGGGYLGEPNTKAHIWHVRLLIRHLSIVFFSIITNKPYIFIGVGAGPLTNFVTRRLVTIACNRSKKVVVRDEESRNYLIKYGVNPSKVIKTADSVLAINKIYSTTKEEGRINIGFHLPTEHNDKGLEEVILDLKKFCDKQVYYKIYVFKDFYKNGFDDISEERITGIFKENIEYVEYINPNQLINLICGFDILITNKLHCGIVGLTQGVYTLSLSKHPKIERLYKQLGLFKYTYDLDSYKQGWLLEMLDDWEIHKQQIPLEIKKAAERNKKLTLEFILDSFTDRV